MVIRQILNNNAVMAADKSQEVIVTGTGIGFKQMSGNVIDVTQVRNLKIYRCNKQIEDIHSIYERIPQKVFTVTEKIGAYVGNIKGKAFSANSMLILADHIYESLNRYEKGIILKNGLLYELKNFYMPEWEIGKFAVDLINSTFDVKLDENEAGFIALHIINISLENMNEAYDSVHIVNDIVKLVQYNMNHRFSEESWKYMRFIIHLKYFSVRVINKSVLTDKVDAKLLAFIKETYPRTYLCSEKVAQYISQKYKYNVDENEKIYLSLHIGSLIEAE